MRKIVFYLSISLLTFLAITVLLHFFFRPENLDKIFVMNDGWDVTYNGKLFKDVNLPTLRDSIGTTTQKGDVLILSKTVEGLDAMVSPTIHIDTRFSAWRLSVNGVQLLSRFYDSLEKNKFIGNDHYFVAIPQGNNVAIINIELVVNEDGAYSSFDAPLLGSSQDLMLYIIFTNMFVFFVSVFLTIFGMLFFAISAGFKTTVPEMQMQIYSSLLYILLANWLLAQFGLLDFFIDTKGHQTEIEYLTLYLALPVMHLVMGSAHNYFHNKLFLSFATVGSSIIFILIILHFTNLVHINRFLWLFQLDALVFAGLMIYLLLRDGKKNLLTMSQIIQIVGQTILAISFLLNLIFYYLEVAGISAQVMLSKKMILLHIWHMPTVLPICQIAPDMKNISARFRQMMRITVLLVLI